ncbi:hypothetical protein [Streptomyces edwardsiae]|uniref:Uncharacterized protein n=1 Tax=Streptomyces edwardsiae TaxID=3075527 RepID=A0ABU2PYY3_9ACTN|nr:hypothetical protein [Streptomyces sp. DSM 41636]MDT0395925.1 hypothetical protein [Streptomyces sp. DSM 41636]
MPDSDSRMSACGRALEARGEIAGVRILKGRVMHVGWGRPTGVSV